LKIIGFAGMPFSGKSEAVKIAKEMKIPVIRMGDIVWKEVINRNMKINDKNVGYIANEMRKKHGKNIWAKKTIEEIKDLKDTKYLVIDGIRNLEEVETFKKKLEGNFILVGIELSDKTRYERALKRNREDDSKDLEKIKKRDKRELGWGLGSVIASSDIIVSNEKDIESFREEIKKIFNEL
jgi:dephospho-CoA kinase